MAQLTFHGATGTVTGSRYLLEIDDKKVLVDCGMFQGPKEFRVKNWEPFPVPPAQVDDVFLTHAHIDHVGYLPRFCRDNFKGTVRCTHATHELAAITLRDSAHLQEEDALWANKEGYSKHQPAEPLYTTEDAEATARFFEPLHYGEQFLLTPEVRVKFKDAGHILGSALIDIRSDRNGRARKLVFTGDLGRPDLPLLRDPVQVYDVDYLVIESTYGDRLHEALPPDEALARVINQSIRRGGVLVIPSFAIGRTQTLLYVIRELEERRAIPVVPVYVDSPMAVEATEVFERRIADFDLTSRTLYLAGKQIMRPQKLQFCRTQAESKAINTVKERAIIVSAGGMATGGRVLHHLERLLPGGKNTVLWIGYQAEGTRGRSILEGDKWVKIHGQQVAVKAAVESIDGFSGHADYQEALAWLMAFNRPPEKTFIVHGEPAASAAMAEKIRSRFGWDVVVPKLGEQVELDL
ncbi:MAG: MBL fold metallo-hydrolase [candidate division Zixibacteria bacterium]|nr:MBL fold metallo-hydrolase [candidate division Zixibacteria bacterium]